MSTTQPILKDLLLQWAKNAGFKWPVGSYHINTSRNLWVVSVGNIWLHVNETNVWGYTAKYERRQFEASDPEFFNKIRKLLDTWFDLIRSTEEICLRFGS